jgi:enoyl-CoA hydratase/carnithine racemase
MAPVLVDRWHGATRIRFDEPDRRNAIGLDTVRSIKDALADRPDAVAVLGSTDPATFSAGADLKAEDSVRQRISSELYDCYTMMLTRPGPVLAVLEGVTVGGGAQLATACDVRISGPHSRWRWVGPAHGLAVGSWVLPALVGRGRALELMLSSRWVDADEAARIGLTARVSDDPWAAAAHLVDDLAGLVPTALAAIKHVSLHSGLLASLRAERDANQDWSGHVPSSGADRQRAARS